jgi:hypothetical protein
MKRLAAVLALLLSPPAWAHGGSDWLLAVAASYSAVLLGAGCGLWAAWWSGLTLKRLLPLYTTALLALAAWLGTDDWPFALGLVAIACVLISGAYLATRWVGRLVRRRKP